jgi:hypothetical protein
MLMVVEGRRALGHLLAVVGISILLLTSAAAQQAQPLDSTEDLLMNFYKDPRPQRLIGYFEAFDKLPVSRNWEAYPPIVGFFAVIFRKHPDRIEQIIPASINPRAADALAAALMLSGNQKMSTKLRPRFEQAGSDARLKTQLAGLPPRLESVQIQIPTHLDIMWGAAFASGDSTFVLMIVDYLAQTVNASEAVTVDVARTMAAMFGGPKKEVLVELRKKYGDARFVQIAFAATALWALNANSMRHEFVEQAIAKYVADHADAPAGKLLAMRPKSKKP